MLRKFKREIDSFEIEKIEDNFCLKVETDKRKISYTFKSAWECQMWVNALRRSIEVDKEIKRTVNGIIKYNAALLYEHYNEKQEADIIKMINTITDQIKANMKTQDFNNALKLVSKEINYFYDAFYAHKPFAMGLFKFVSVQIHKPTRDHIFQFWSKNKNTFNAGDVISFMNAVSVYERSLKAWGIDDSRFNGWINPLLKTFISKLFNNCKSLLANILYDQRNKFYLQNQKIITRSPEALESHLNFIFDHYSQVPSIEAAQLLLTTCSTILSLFLMNTRNFVRKEKFPLQIYIALLNNSFLKIIKNFTRKVNTTTKNQITLKQIKTSLDEEYLISIISEIEKLCYNKIAFYISRKVSKEFQEQNDFMSIKLQILFDKLIEDCSKVIDTIENRFTANDLLFDVFNNIMDIYYKKCLEFTPKVTSKNLNDFKEKIKSDAVIVNNLLENQELEKGPEIGFKMKYLETFVITDDLDQALISLINMNVLYPEIIEPNNIDKLIRLKAYFSKRSKDYITTYLKSSLEEFRLRNSTKKNLWHAFTIKPLVMQFIKNLSKFKRKSCRE